ncbi:hypothetical protein GTQ43_06905 [Nostoc sp. KVJ3]|uniref:hypothetical protein n=1 Tax=Nostoc sp. KVJ3 TaxID=457945 RepID=UPI002237DCD5|nr:hypothetical protein [Nostoc sp. KVJ3]MCW5313550.1 hypothetical protein [Nostoc sp. KVJ3]
MLLRVVIIPSIFIPRNDKNPWYFNTIISLLQDLLKTCVVLVDKDDCIKKSLGAAINNWPEKFRKKAQSLLVQLDKANRIIAVDSKDILALACINHPCQHCIGIAKTYLPRIVLAIDDCYKCAREQLSSVKIVPIVHVANYTVSNFADTCQQNSCGITLANGDWTQEQFEENILIPLFRDAKHIKIYDRMIGRSIRDKLEIKAFIPEHYNATLTWFLEVYLKCSSHKSTGIFEVYSGFDTGYLNEAKISEAQRVLRQFEKDMQTKFSFPSFKLTIKEEVRREQEMTHGRYLITDQIAILIERGFDLLWDDEQMINAKYNLIKDSRRIRDVGISYCQDSSIIANAVKQLPDL